MAVLQLRTKRKPDYVEPRSENGSAAGDGNVYNAVERAKAEAERITEEAKAVRARAYVEDICGRVEGLMNGLDAIGERRKKEKPA